MDSERGDWGALREGPVITGVNNHVTRIGLISDTHGLLRKEAVHALRGSDLIIHAGDVGKPELIDVLLTLAPVVAVRGNIDTGAWASRLPSRCERAFAQGRAHGAWAASCT